MSIYIAAITATMLAGALWRYRQRDMIGMAASFLLAAYCAYALMLSPASSKPVMPVTARCEFFLRILTHRRGLTYIRVNATEQDNPLKVTIEFETRNKAHAPGRSIGSCEFEQDRRHISFLTVDGWRSWDNSIRQRTVESRL